MRVEVCVFRLDLFELLLCLVKRLPVRPLSQLLKDVSGAAVVEGFVCSPGDVLQLVVLQLEICQVNIHPLEGVIRKPPRGQIHVLPRDLSLSPARSGNVRGLKWTTWRRRRMMWRGRRRRVCSPETFRRASRLGWGRFQNWVVALRASVVGH